MRDGAQTIDLSEAPTSGIVPGLVWAFRFDADGAAESLPVDAPIEERPGSWLWLHLNLGDARVGEWLAASALPGPAKDLLSRRGTHQQLNAVDACIFGVFSDLVRKLDATDDSVAHLYFAMTESALISGRRHAVTGATKLRDALNEGQFRTRSVAGLFEAIVVKLSEGVEHFIGSVAQELDTIEDLLARGAYEHHRTALSRIRRTNVKLHRELAGLRAVFARLDDEAMDALPLSLRFAARKLAVRLDALDHDVLEIRDRARLLQEEINAATAEASNRALTIISVLSAIFLPPTLVSGIFGMNVKGLPFADDSSGFLWTCALMAGSVSAVYIILRRIGALRF
jgi:zinc transporter